MLFVLESREHPFFLFRSAVVPGDNRLAPGVSPTHRVSHVHEALRQRRQAPFLDFSRPGIPSRCCRLPGIGSSLQGASITTRHSQASVVDAYRRASLGCGATNDQIQYVSLRGRPAAERFRVVPVFWGRWMAGNHCRGHCDFGSTVPELDI